MPDYEEVDHYEEEEEEEEGIGGVLFQRYPLIFHSSGLKEFLVNPLKRHISVEIECDNFRGSFSAVSAVTKKWKDTVTKDGSLHGHYAHETDTAPTNGDKFIKHITELGNAYHSLNSHCSEECGLHVHIDGRDIKFYDLRKIILLYARVEKALFGLCNPSRVNNTYSAICGKQWLNMEANPTEFKRQLVGKFYSKDSNILKRFPDQAEGREIKEGQRDKYRRVRYRALNIHSWFLRKTIEFRHHEGTVDKETIINWSLICGHVVDFANRMSEAQISNLPVNSKSSLLAVIPEKLHSYCKEVWSKNKIDWTLVDQKENKPSLPQIPAEDKGLDKKGWIIKRKKERQAMAIIEANRIKILRAIITDTLSSVDNTASPF